MDFPRTSLCCLPTPCHALPRLSAELGLDLWIKRDDLTGFAFGGNKGRKLEYLIAEALAQGADTVVSCGAAQSNFVRQLGAAASVVGLRCVAAVMDLPYSVANGQPECPPGIGEGGNVLLDDLLGIELRRYPNDDWEVLYSHAEAISDELEAKGAKVYRVPLGGSCPLGAYSFYRAASEVGEDWDAIICPCSSGSTHVGLAYAFAGTKTRVIGVAADPEPEILDDLVILAAGLRDLLGAQTTLRREDIEFRLEWAGDAYGLPSPAGEAASQKLARTEGIFVDPVYSAKAFSGLLGMAANGELRGRVLFWHTGGLPAMFHG